MIIDLQRRLAEIGRIRIGQQVPIGKTGKTRPAKLDTFRLTSPDKARILAAAKLYGGTPEPWDAPAGPQYEVITDATSLPVIVPPSDMAFTQYYELWSGGGCQRRCNGRDETISDGPCLCDPDERECDIHTRLSVMLRDMPGLGLWRIDTKGWNAALELQGAVEVLQMAAGHGQMLPAQLRLEQRMIKRPGTGTRRFAVPVLDVEITPQQLIAGVQSTTIEPRAHRQLDASTPFTPVPDTVREQPVGSVAEQVATPPKKRQQRGQIPVPPSGIKPRTADQIAVDRETAVASVETARAEMDSAVEAVKKATEYEEHPVIRQVHPDWGRQPDGGGEQIPADFSEPTHEQAVEQVKAIFGDGIGAPEYEDEPELIDPTSSLFKKLQIVLRNEYGKDRDTALDMIAAIIRHPVDSTKNLTPDEASQIIDVLENDRPDD